MINYALLLAGGEGKRTNENTPKAFIKINERYLLEYSIITFSNNPNIQHIILVVPEKYLSLSHQIIREKNYHKIYQVVTGGSSRFESSSIGINLIKEEKANVLIHDTARPFVSQQIINNCVKELQQSCAVNVLSPLSDSLIQIHANTIQTVDRNNYRLVQTPQGFEISTIKKAHKQARQNKEKNITDDYSLVVKYQNCRFSWIEGSHSNFKITYPNDLILAEKLLAINES